MRKLQLTLAIFKPDLTLRPYSVEFVRDIILKNDFIFIRSKFEHLSRSKVENFYKEHEAKFFYNRLVTYMASGKSQIYILGRENEAIHKWRSIMGPTKVFKTRFENPDTIRGSFGISDTRNSTHGSDSDDNARAEIAFFFPDFDYDQFFSSGQDQLFLQQKASKKLKLDPVQCQHFLH